MGVGLSLLLALLPTLALAQAPVDRFGGVEIADVRLLAPDGGLPEESLDALLRARSGEALSLFSVRTDLVTLMRVGEFSAVEAEAEPWFTQDATGELREAVMLTYMVWPAPRVAEVNLSGVTHLNERDVRSELALDIGDVFYEELAATTTQSRLRRHYANHGHPKARVDVLAAPTEDGVVVDVLVEEGPAQNLVRLNFSGDLPVPRKVLTRWARKKGLREGKPVALRDVTAAQRHIRSKLAGFSTLRPKHGGWVQVRVTPAWVEEGDNLIVTYSIEPGQRLELAVTGIPWRPVQQARQALVIDERVRLTRGFIDVAPDRMADALAKKGFYKAKAEVTLNRGAETQVLAVDVDRGSRHVLRGDLPWRRRGIRFIGNEQEDHSSLRTVIEQTSPDVVRLGRITDDELEKGLRASEKYYQSKGYLDAKLELTDLSIRKRQFPRSILDSLSTLVPGAVDRVLIDLEITVDEGNLTLLDALTISGSAVELDFVETARARLEQSPYSPQALEALAREIVEAHRNDGYLEADARVVSRLTDPSHYNATIEVTSGDQILLRSIVTRGSRRTRRAFLRREVDQPLGSTITTEKVDALRRGLVELGTFHSVDLALLGDEPGRDLLITVEERPIHSYEIGGGASTDQGIRAFGRYTRHNLFGIAHRLDAFGSVGVEYASDSLSDWRPDFGTEPEWRAGVTYTAPRFPLRSQKVVLDLLLRERRFERTYEIAQFGVSAGLITQLSTQTQIRLGAKLMRRRLEDADVGALLRGDSTQPKEVWVDLLRFQDGPLTDWRTQDTLEVIALQDWRDDPLTPTRGAVVRLVGELAPGALGAVSYVKTEARVTGWIPLGGPSLRITAEGGRAFMLGDGILPLEERYRIGGTGSLRGFRRDAVGPRREVDQVDLDWPSSLAPLISEATRKQPKRWVPAGGDTMAMGIFELVLPLPVLGMTSWDGYALTLFTDVGNVWLLRGTELVQSESDAVRNTFSAPLRSSIGLGLSIETPIGPLGIDFATNLQSATAQGAKHTLLQTNWEEPPMRVHLSIGALQ